MKKSYKYHLYISKSCIDLQNKEGLAQKLDLPCPVNDPNKVSVVSTSPLMYASIQLFLQIQIHMSNFNSMFNKTKINLV